MSVLPAEQQAVVMKTVGTGVHACPVCDRPDLYSLPTLIFHMNDVHRWTWDMFANKFPPILPEDLEGQA